MKYRNLIQSDPIETVIQLRAADHLVAVSGRLDVLRHGLDQDLIMLRTESLPALR